MSQSTTSWIARVRARPWTWLALVAVAFALQIGPGWQPTPDSVAYLSTARALADEGSLRSLGSGHLAYPPGYPLLASLAFLFGERPFVALGILHVLVAVLLVAGTYHWARRVVPASAVLVTGLVAANVSLWIHLHRTLSDLAFATALVWAALALDRLAGSETPRVFVRRAVLAVLLLVAASLVREVGALLAAGFAAAVIARGPASLGLRVGAAVAVLGFAAAATGGFVAYDQATAAASPVPVGTHLHGFRDPAWPIAERIPEATRLRVAEVGRLLLPGMFKAYGDRGEWLHPTTVIYVPFFLVVAFGWLRLVRRRPEVFGLTLPFYAGVYLLWPFDAGTRYFLPVLPVLAASLASALAPFGPWRPRILTLLVAAHVAVATGYVATRELPRDAACHALWPVVDALAPHIRGEPFALDGVVACPGWMLAFELDRRPVAASAATRIVAPAGIAPPDGFRVLASRDGYRVLVAASSAR